MENENVNTKLDKNLIDYINGEKNVLVGTDESPVSLARSYKNGHEYISGYYGDIPVPVTYGPNYAKKSKIITHISSDEIRIDKKEEGKKPKGTGGKEAYVMLKTKHEETIKGLSAEACAIILHMCIGGIQWNTGKLVQNRSRKPHTASSISKLIKTGLRKTKSVLKELSDANIIKYDKAKKVYFMNIDIARKGMVMENEDKV